MKILNDYEYDIKLNNANVYFKIYFFKDINNNISANININDVLYFKNFIGMKKNDFYDKKCDILKAKIFCNNFLKSLSKNDEITNDYSIFFFYTKKTK